MEKIKLFQLISTLDVKEWERFELFVSSLYFNQNEINLRFVELVKAYYPDRLEIIADKRILHQKLFPKQAFHDKAVRYAMSDLCKMIESFFATEAFQNHAYQKELILLDELSQRELPKAYAHQKKRMEKQSEQLKIGVQDFRFFSFKWQK